MTAVFLIVPMIISNQTILAGDSGCQSGTLAHKYDNYSRQTIAEQKEKQEQFQAAQIRNGENKPPTSGGLAAADSEMRSRISYLASVFFLLGGIWLLFSLLRERLPKRYAPKSVRRAKVWNLALKPSFALSVFAFLFVTVIAGSFLTSPTVTSAQKNEQNSQLNDKENPVNLGLPTYQPVFKEGQQIGGDGVTQIGAPVFDADGNRYVRGAFSGELTIGDTTLTSTFGLDMFIAKYDANLNPVWVRQGSGLPSAPHEDLAVEGATAMSIFESVEDGNYLYVAGSFVKTLTLQGGANPSVTLNDNGASGYNYEAFLAKYDLNGNLIWVRGGNSGSPKNPDNLETGQNAINKIVFDNFGDPYVAGLISGDNFLGSSVSSFVCSSNQNCSLHGKSDIIIAKLDKTSGTPTRVHVLGGSDDDNGLDLAIDNVTNPQIPKLYLVGNFSSPQVVLPNSIGYETYTNTANSINSFVLRFDSDNIQRTTIDGIWSKVLNNDGIIGVNQVATDPQIGQLYITGYYTGTISGLGGPFGASITNNRTGTGEEALAGYVGSMDSSNGTFLRLASLGGVGNALAVRPSDGVIFVAGSLWDTGEFNSSGDVRTLESLDGNDLFVAGINRGNFQFDSVKAISGTGYQGLVAADNPSTADGGTKNRYSPLGIAFDSNRVFVSGDFAGTMSLDCITLKTPNASRHAFIAEFLGYGESTTCRIWTGGGYWIEPSNWNAGIVPAANDSVYVPYHRTAQYNPIYNPSFYVPNSNVPLNSVIVSDNQTIILEENLSVGERLDLLGGKIDAGNKQVNLGPTLETYSTNGGRVIGKLEKLFFGMGDSFTFPVGTANGYSPVTLSNYNAGKGATFAVTAHQGSYPNPANNLPANRAARWWNLTNGGLVRTDLTFQYLPGDIMAGNESDYRAYRIPSGGGTAISIPSTVNTATKTVSVPNVSQFSDWTLAQPLIPTAATANIGGRVLSANGQGIANARITITDSTGNSQTISTNSFGYYTFRQVLAGDTYILTARHKRYNFSQPTQIVSVSDDRDDINFVETP